MYVLIIGSPDWRIIHQASCIQGEPLEAALVWGSEGINEDYQARAVDTKWDMIWYHLVGSPTPTEQPRGHWDVDYISYLTESLPPLPLQNMNSCLIGVIIPNKTWITQPSKLTFYHALWTTSPPLSANLGGPTLKKLWLPRMMRAQVAGSLRFDFFKSHILWL